MDILLDQRSCDIFEQDHSIRLATNAPDIFNDYALSSNTPFSIVPDMKTLLQDSTFRDSAQQHLGSSKLCEIKIRGEDHAVLVRDPYNPSSQFVEVRHCAIDAVQEVSQRTQMTYRRFIESLTSNNQTVSPAHQTQRFCSRSPSSEPLSLPTTHHVFYDSRIRELESQNRELQLRMENLESRCQIEQNAVAGLTEKIRELQEQLRIEKETHSNSQLSFFIALCLAIATLNQMNEINLERQSHIERLQAQQQELLIHSTIQESILEQAQALTQAEHPKNLCEKIQALQRTLKEEERHNHQLKGALTKSEDTERSLQKNLREIQQKLNRLNPENTALKEEIEKVGFSQTETLKTIAEMLGESVNSTKDLPGVIQAALKKIEESKTRAETLEAQVMQLKTELKEKKYQHAYQKDQQAILQPSKTEVKTPFEQNNDQKERLNTLEKELHISRKEAKHFKELLGQIDILTKEISVERDPLSLADELTQIGLGENFQRLAAEKQSPQYVQLPKKIKDIVDALLQDIRELKQKDLSAQEKEAAIAELALQLEHQKKGSTQMQTALQQNIKDLQEELEQTRIEAKTVKENSEQLVDNLRTTLHQQRTTAESDQALALEKIQDLTVELRETKQTIIPLTNQLKQREDELENKKEYVDDLNGRIENLKEKEKQLQIYQKALDTAQKTCNEWKEDATEWENHYRTLDNKYSQIFSEEKRVRENQEKESRYHQESLKALLEEIDCLSQKNSHQKAALITLEKELNVVHQELSQTGRKEDAFDKLNKKVQLLSRKTQECDTLSRENVLALLDQEENCLQELLNKIQMSLYTLD